jgi:hypothetical protein
MDLEINRPLNGPIIPIKDVNLSKLDLTLFLGQALKAVVLTPLTDGQITININGQNISAKTKQQFTPGETLDVKVVSTEEDVVLQVQQPPVAPGLQKTILQNALLQALPKQAPPTALLENLKQLVQATQSGHADKLPPEIMQQIKTLLSTIPTISQLPQQLTKAVSQSGVFLESSLLQAPSTNAPTEGLQTDIKAQYLKLLNSLPIELKNNLLASTSTQNTDTLIQRDTLALPGAIPQPLHKEVPVNLLDKSPATIQTAIHDQINQALSRITSNQVTHLSQAANPLPDDNKTGFLIMMDIPVKTSQNDIDVIPLMIKQRKGTATEPTQWSMSFAVSLSELGDMQGTVTLNGNAVNVKINTEKQETIDTLKNNQVQMESLLSEMGLSLGGLNIQKGLANNQIPTENLHLLDIRI